MKIVGLSGFARAGKDSVAEILVRDHGFVQVAFADKLREMLYALNPLLPPVDFGQGTSPKICYVQDFIDKFGWSGYKENDGWHIAQSNEVRRLLQRLGTEAGRQTLWDSIWIDAALTGLDEEAKVVVSDARFINEFEAIHERGGEMWRIERPGVGPANEHASEMEATTYNKFKHHIMNDGSLEDLATAVQFCLDASDDGWNTVMFRFDKEGNAVTL